MEPMTDEVTDVRPALTTDVGAAASANLDALREQRIRFDGYFSGPTW